MRNDSVSSSSHTDHTPLISVFQELMTVLIREDMSIPVWNSLLCENSNMIKVHEERPTREGRSSLTPFFLFRRAFFPAYTSAPSSSLLVVGWGLLEPLFILRKTTTSRFPWFFLQIQTKNNNFHLVFNESIFNQELIKEQENWPTKCECKGTDFIPF